MEGPRPATPAALAPVIGAAFQRSYSVPCALTPVAPLAPGSNYETGLSTAPAASALAQKEVKTRAGRFLSPASPKSSSAHLGPSTPPWGFFLVCWRYVFVASYRIASHRLSPVAFVTAGFGIAIIRLQLIP
jgi:hypothetical protein